MTVRYPIAAPLSRTALLARRKREQAIERAVVRALDPHDPRLGLKPEYRRRHAAGCDPTTGFCSVAVEAMWALLGGNAAGYERRQIRHEGGSHWFLADVVGGRWIDPTRSQFATPLPYEKGRGSGLPVTRKAGVLYHGDPALLISNKAAHLIALATGRALQRNPSKRVVVPTLPPLATLTAPVVFRGWHATRRRDQAESILAHGFRYGEGFFGRGVYLATNLATAGMYIGRNSVLLEVVARVERPLILGVATADDLPPGLWARHRANHKEFGDQINDAAREDGRDAILVHAVGAEGRDDGGDQACLFDTSMVLSIRRAPAADRAEALRLEALASSEYEPR